MYCIVQPSVQDQFKSVYLRIIRYIGSETKALTKSAKNTRRSKNGNIPTDTGCVVIDGQFEPTDLLNIPVGELRSPPGYTPPKHSVETFSLKDLKRGNWKNLRLLIVNECQNVDAYVNNDNGTLLVRVFSNSEDRNIFVHYQEIDDLYDTVSWFIVTCFYAESLIFYFFKSTYFLLQ